MLGHAWERGLGTSPEVTPRTRVHIQYFQVNGTDGLCYTPAVGTILERSKARCSRSGDMMRSPTEVLTFSHAEDPEIFGPATFGASPERP